MVNNVLAFLAMSVVVICTPGPDTALKVVGVAYLQRSTEMIIRAWRGWTTAERADEYERLLNATIAPAIMQRGIAGLRELAILRRPGDPEDSEVEFLTFMTFDDQAAVTEFAGPDPSASVVPPAARALLARHDAHSQHYELVRRHVPPGS